MSDDNRNKPFRRLAERLLVRDNKPDLDKPCATPAPAGKKQAASTPATDNDEDASLFLDAVSHIRPLRHKENEKYTSGGHNLTDSMRALKETPARTRTADKGRTPPIPAQPVVPAAKAEAESFGAPMRQPFAPPGPAPDNTGGPDRPNTPPDRPNTPPDRPNTPPDSPETSADSSPAREEERKLFAKAVAGTRPLNDKGRDLAPAAKRKQMPPAVDPAKALREILEGRLEFALHHTDEYMEGFVVGLDPLVLARLRAGRYSPEKHLDLHGMNSRQAFDVLTHFLKDAYQRNMRCVVVVTGRGRNSPDGVGVLRPSLQNWLSRDPFKRVVLAFCTAKAGDGGPGAAYVLLRKYKKSRGKIIWERGPADDDFPDL